MALEQNAMKITRSEAVKQVKKMMNLVNDITSTTIKNSVNGEEFRTQTKGVQILMSKYEYVSLSLFENVQHF